MAEKSLTDIIKEMLDADRVGLPVHPTIAQQVIACRADEDPDSHKLWTLVGRDPSSFFAGLQKTASIEEVVTRLGRSKARQVVKRVCREDEGLPQGELLHRYMNSLRQHAQGCALGARSLAKRCGYQSLVDQAYLAGMFHDIGNQHLLAVLQEMIATMHVEQGLRLFEEWNLPEIYREVVANHHDGVLDTQNILVALVKLAGKCCRKAGIGLMIHTDIVLPTTAEAQFLGIDEVCLAEFEIMLEDQFPGRRQAASGQ